MIAEAVKNFYFGTMMNHTHDMLEAFEGFLARQRLVRAGDRVLLAVSGGIDSMVMLDLFRRIANPWRLLLGIAHLNHMLRGEESDQDEAFVVETAARLGLPVWTDRVDVAEHRHRHGGSKQEVARELRYRFFERARTAMGADRIATAHQADDNAETVLMNALRGAGVRGLSGIPLQREGSVIRPLLFARRREIEQYAAVFGVRFREDSSNRSTESTRNTVRHLFLPGLNSALETDTIEGLNRVAESMRSLSEAISSEFRGRMKDVFTDEQDTVLVSIVALRAMPLYLQEEAALSLFRRLAIEPTAGKVHAFLDLCDHPTGRTLHLTGRWHVLRDRDRLVVHPAGAGEGFRHTVAVGHAYALEGFRFASHTLASVPRSFSGTRESEVIDADRLGRRLTLRSWRPGDTFVPLGMREPKKLSDFFVDQKVPRHRKLRTALLESDGAIVWVCGLRLDHRFRVTPDTTRAVRLEYSLTPP